MPDLLELFARHGAEDRVTLASFSGEVMGRVRSLGYRGRTALTRREIVWLRFLPPALARSTSPGTPPDPDPLRAHPARWKTVPGEVSTAWYPHRLLGGQRSRGGALAVGCRRLGRHDRRPGADCPGFSGMGGTATAIAGRLSLRLSRAEPGTRPVGRAGCQAPPLNMIPPFS